MIFLNTRSTTDKTGGEWGWVINPTAGVHTIQYAVDMPFMRVYCRHWENTMRKPLIK